MILLLLFVLVLLIELIFKPRLDMDKKGNFYLWYGIKTRKYIKL
jgi:hypothetical protein